MNAITETKLPLPLFRRGKVRDTYDLGASLLMVATDRLSAFDVVFAQGIPYKGTVLTQLSLFWFDYLKDIIENHVLGEKIPASLKNYAPLLAGRSLVVKKAKPLPVECVVRGYLSGSGWKDYKQSGKICGISLPKGLRESEKLPEPIFTPSTKAEIGHDENVGFEYVVKKVGEKTANQLQDLSIKLYKKAAAHAEKCGIILADTKFEFGILGNKLILIDEVLTPDSSRFWPADKYSPGRPQPSFDKQYVRDYLAGIGWNKKPPAPTLPKKIIDGTSKKYIAAYEKITGKKFER